MMKRNKIICFLWLLCCFPGFAQEPFGINLSGGEFGTAYLPGTFNVNYTYPNNNELIYYHGKGLDLIRLPFRWERIQPVLAGPLDEAELSRIKNVVHQAHALNMKVLLDVHNFGSYNVGGTGYKIGSSQVSVSDFQDLWVRLADSFKNEPNIWGYDIMNEPNAMLASAPWFPIAQAAINGIRSRDSVTTIVVEGDAWASATSWPTVSDTLRYLTDPYHALVYEAHCYFDDNGSGTYNDTTVAAEGASLLTGVNRVQPFVNWLATYHLKGFVGEFGVPHQDSAWLPVLDTFMNYLKANCVNGTYWGGGPWWPESYPLKLDPNNGVDKVPMSVVENYTATLGNCSYLEPVYPLPVKLSSFNVYSTGAGTARILWQAKEEKDLSYYELQRSSDGENFYFAARVNPHNNWENIPYTFDDDIREMAGTVVFYRLKMVDKDGTTVYSVIRNLSLVPDRRAVSVQVFPNPVNGPFNLVVNSTAEQDATVSFYDAHGRVWQQSRIRLSRGSQVFRAAPEAAGWPAGVYIVQVVTPDTTCRQVFAVR